MNMISEMETGNTFLLTNDSSCFWESNQLCVTYILPVTGGDSVVEVGMFFMSYRQCRDAQETRVKVPKFFSVSTTLNHGEPVN